MAKWLKVNEKTLDAMLLAVRRTRYFMPGVSPGQDVNVPTRRCLGLVACMGIRDGLVSRAMLKSASGDMQGAWTDLTAARLFARRLAQSCAPVECLIALEIEKTACQAIRAIACSGRLTEKQTRTFLTDMQRLEPIPDVVNLIDEQGRFLVLDFVMILARTFPKSGTKWIADIIEPLTPDITANLPAISPDVKTLEFDEMLLIINRWHDSFISAARRKTFKARKQALADHDRRIKKHISQTKEFMALNKKKATTRMMASRMIANALIARTLSPHHRMVMRRDETTAQSDTALVTMALAAYHADKKTYPAKLSQLKLEYLRSIPSDVFIDKPFGYKRKGKGYLLYSVGENMRLDDREDDYVKDDIAVEVQ
ncbi:MAG: hypothetical protein QGH94_00410 [Phycisphaerae bacterium]|nr:hypothetical protein [Phycisphaerae bacterium]